ncbi:MAG: hypothetical protein HXY50_00775 [Ignavibacteriaceae bacterium]|nr:hypothetical protein [Ignavibacteriaceae bacterium]
MKLFLPNNIFSKILSSALKSDDELIINTNPSGLLSKNLISNLDSVALIPVLDLLNHKDLFISKKAGISFDESLSNSYIYFNQHEKLDKEIVLAGDVSSNEAILTKILFSETYNSNVQLSFEKINGGASTKNRVLVGDRNFIDENLSSAISFTEEIIELISAPYVNFVIASNSEEMLNQFHLKFQKVISSIDPIVCFEKFNNDFPPAAKNYLSDNLQHITFSFDEQDIEGVTQLLQLPYFHGIIDDMIDIKFV